MRHLRAQNARPRQRPIFAIALAALCLGALRPWPAAGQCTLPGGPTSISQFEPYPTGAQKPQYPTIRGFFPYQPPGLGPRLLVAEPMGYQVLDISNRSNPQSLGFEDYRTGPGWPPPIPCGGDCHVSIGPSAVSADGGRAIFGLSALAAGSTSLQTMVGQPSTNGWGFTLGGDMAPKSPGDVLVQRVGSGSNYVAYTFADDGVRVADATTLPGIDPDAPNPNSLGPSLAGTPSLPGGYQPTISGYWVTYWDGSNIYLVNASSPLPVKDRAKDLTAQRFTKTDFGRSSPDRLVSFSAAQDPADPAAMYLLGEFALGSSGSKPAGWTLIRVRGGAPTVVGSLQPGTGETFTYINALAADKAGNLFAFMWVKTPSGAFRQYTSPALAFGDAAKNSFDVTTAGFSLGRPAYVVSETVAGQIYAYVPGSISGWIVPMSCVSLDVPAVASMTVTDQAGATLNDNDTVNPPFLGDQITITPRVSPSLASQPLTGFGPGLNTWNFDFDFHAGTASDDFCLVTPCTTPPSPRLKAPDNSALGSPAAPPGTITVVGPCDPASGNGNPNWNTGAGCWTSVTTNGAFAGGTADFILTPVAGSAKPLTFAFEVHNALGSAGASLFTLNWRVPAAKLQTNQILSGGTLVSASDGHPTAYQWFFGPDAQHLTASCATSSCAPPSPYNTKGTYAYSLTAKYFVDQAFTTTATGTYTVTDFVPAFAVNGSATGPASALINQNLTVTNSSQRGATVTGGYQYSFCQPAPCADNYVSSWSMNDPTSTSGSPASSATIPIPATKGSYALKIKVNYTGGPAFWPDPAGAAYFPVNVVDVVPTIRIYTNGQNPCPPPWGCSTAFAAYVNDSLTAYSYNGSVPDANPPSISWDFGGGSPSSGTGQGSQFSYGSPGTYTVTLHGYTDPVTTTVVVTQHVPISVSAFANPSSTTVGANVSFSCSASGGSGSGYTYSWSGAVSGSSQSISRSFASPSTYTATCTVSDSQGSASGTASVTVTGGSSGNQQIWFNCSPGFSCPDKGSVSASTGMNITAYAYVNNALDTTTQNLTWNAPGASPQSGSGRSFTLSYSSPGTYPLTLNGYGSPVTATVTVTGSPAGGACPTFDFDIQHPAGTSARGSSTQGAGGFGTGGFSASVGWTLWFTQNLGNAPSSWSWNFGDTETANTQTPQHVYTKAGDYTVTLTIPSSDGASQCPKSKTINLTGPSGGFSPQYLGDNSPFAPSNVTPNKNVLFTALDPPSLVDAYLWDFGDSTPHGSDLTATHAFNPGSWTVKLTVTKGSASVSTTLVLTVPTPPEPPKWVVPGMAYSNGQVPGTSWQSDVAIFNPDPTRKATYSVAFLDARSPVDDYSKLTWTPWIQVDLPPLGSAASDNILYNFFKQTLGAYGAIMVRGDVSPLPPVITARTYNNGDPTKGTFGLSVPPTSVTGGVSAQAPPAASVLIGLKQNAAAYTNLGLVNLNNDWPKVQLDFIDGLTAEPLASKVVDMNPYQSLQITQALQAAGYEGTSDLYTVKVKLLQGTAVYPFSTVIDTRSTHPIVVTPPAVPSNAYRIPGIVRLTGQNGEHWRSRVTVSNPSSGSRSVRMVFSYISCDTGGCGSQISIVGDIKMASGQTQSWDDFVSVWLSVKGHIPVDDATSYQASFLDVSPTPGDPTQEPLVVLGETYNATTNGDVGFQIPGYTPLDGASGMGAQKRLALTGLSSTTAYRTNLALFVVAGAPGKWVNVHVYSPEGTKLRDIPVLVDGFSQVSNGTLFSGLPGDLNRLSIVVDNIDDGVTVGGYATIIDNTSSDATFVKATPAP